MYEIIKDYIPYEEALEMQELGFNEYCFDWLYYEFRDRGKTYIMLNTPDDMDPHDGVKAPTYSQAFRWFRDKYNIFAYIDKTAYGKFIYNINPYLIFYDEEYFQTYEEAELACLRKLIEIVKEKNNEQQ
jgi:hypothetical protein